MGYRLVCIDMDGTLLNSCKQISKTTKASLLKAHQREVQIVITTGRVYIDAAYYASQIGLRSPIIASNGAYIRDQQSQQLIYQSLLHEKLALRILDICKRYHVSPNFHTPQQEYYGGIYLAIRWLVFCFRNWITGNKSSVKRKYVPNYRQWRRVFAKEQDRMIKCIIIHFNKEKLAKIRNELSRIAELEVVSSASNNIEVNYKGTSKGKGVEILARHYGIPREEIIAIGDNENDLSMIEYAGLGVAMGNALDFVKEKADYITDTNDNDGVAKVIDKFVLNS
ncbi:MAG TPA: Cof-type HAD-IIB family hydrolase [Firmicutes bacterium]|jgi:Cof subfamily protein (haloacid dehalogenase superfamily)|nr:Cof-type HAD-IIB family hydrolase [Bacillota bacterium]